MAVEKVNKIFDDTVQLWCRRFPTCDNDFARDDRACCPPTRIARPATDWKVEGHDIGQGTSSTMGEIAVQ